MFNRIKTADEIKAIRESGRMLATILQLIERKISVGMTGIDIDELAISELKSMGGMPAFLGYGGFPNTICISVNDAVVHGIPDNKPFSSGDVIGFDYGVIYDGMITDAARTYVVGDTTKEIEKLVKTTLRSLDDALNVVAHGRTIGDVSAAAQNALDAGGYGIVRDLVGHGVGHHVHEGPEIPNYGVAGTGPMMKTGMTLAIEPMATMGDYHVVLDPDGWTVRTRDGSIAAHFEDTVLVTDDSCEILTRL